MGTTPRNTYIQSASPSSQAGAELLNMLPTECVCLLSAIFVTVVYCMLLNSDEGGTWLLVVMIFFWVLAAIVLVRGIRKYMKEEKKTSNVREIISCPSCGRILSELDTHFVLSGYPVYCPNCRTKIVKNPVTIK